MSNVSPGPRQRAWLPAAISIGAGILLWQLLVSTMEIPSYVLPRPVAVWNALVSGIWDNPTNRASFWYHLWDTFRATVLGFVIGSALGLVLAAPLIAVLGPRGGLAVCGALMLAVTWFGRSGVLGPMAEAEPIETLVPSH